MSILKIDNKTLSQKVYDHLKEKMITAEIMPGERISLRRIASQLGVSLMPVREALWQLERDKAVVIEHNRHIFVSELSTTDFDELLELRLLLESKAAQLACRRREESACYGVKTALEEMRQSMSDSKRYLQHNHEFHLLIYQFSGMQNLIQMIESLWTRVGPYIYLATTSRSDMLRSMEFHVTMYEALRAGDCDQMLEALKLDLTTAAAEIRPILEDTQRPRLHPSGAHSDAGDQTAPQPPRAPAQN